MHCMSVVGRMMTPQRCPRPNPLNLWMCSVTWQGRIMVIDEIKVAHQLTVQWGSYPGLSEGPCIITRVPQPTQLQCPLLASLVAQVVKNPPAMQETRVLSLIGKIPWRKKWQPTPILLPGESHGHEEPRRLQSVGSQRVGHNWGTKALQVKEGGRRLRVEKEMWWCKQRSERCSGRETWLVTAGFEGGRDHKPRNAGSL